MADVWVSNASPIIVLSKIGRLDLLVDLPDRLVIPRAVIDEVARGGARDPARLALDAMRGYRKVAAGRIAAEVAAWDLGRGESEVLTWAITHPGAEAILDDRAARSAARALSVPVRGTLGVVLAGKKRGKVRSVKTAIHTMLAAGLRLDDALVAEALRLAGEGEP